MRGSKKKGEPGVENRRLERCEESAPPPPESKALGDPLNSVFSCLVWSGLGLCAGKPEFQRKLLFFVSFYSAPRAFLAMATIAPSFRAFTFVGGGRVSGKCMALMARTKTCPTWWEILF